MAGTLSMTADLDFAQVASFFVPAALYRRYAHIIDDISALPNIGLDDAFGLFTCQLWTMDSSLLGQIARWFGAGAEDAARCRDRLLDGWATVWDIDRHALDVPRAEPHRAILPAPPNFTTLARQCRYAVWVPAFPRGDAYVATVCIRQRLQGSHGTRPYSTAFVREIVERLDEFRLNAAIAGDVQELLRAFYARHLPGRARVNALAEETLSALEDSLRDGSSEDGGATWSQHFPHWVRSVALRRLLTRGQPRDESEGPATILERLGPHLGAFVPEGSPMGAAAVAGRDTSATLITSHNPAERKKRRALVLARTKLERRVFLPAGLKPVAAYADPTLMTAARHGRLVAVRFLERWYTTDQAVRDYLPKQEPRAALKRGFRALATLSPYAYFEAMNRYKPLLVRENNRVFISEALWWRLSDELDRPIRTSDVLLRFATSQFDYWRLIVAAKAGRLRAAYDPRRRAWVTTREAVEAYRSEIRSAAPPAE